MLPETSHICSLCLIVFQSGIDVDGEDQSDLTNLQSFGPATFSVSYIHLGHTLLLTKPIFRVLYYHHSFTNHPPNPLSLGPTCL